MVTSEAVMPLLLLLFVGSGCAALIYEIIWFQLLQLVIGSSAISLGVLLGTFMGGMCLGSVALARLVPPGRHPLRVYAVIELGLGLLGVIVLFVVPSLPRLYALYAGHGLPGILLRGLIACACLLPPTLLMGATLPAMARWVGTTRDGAAWLGFFYGGNIAGAVFGCLLAGFYLLRIHDMAMATYVAATINVAVALVAFTLARHTPFKLPISVPKPQISKVKVGIQPRAWPVYLSIALSGLCALGAEVIWTRLLSLLLGPTVYTFSIILAVFLGGLGIGSSLGSVLARWTTRPRLALAWCQILLAPAIAWTTWMIAESLPYWPVNPSLSKSPWFNFQLDLVRCLWAILPATCLWGASFPLALTAVASAGNDPGRWVGKVYAANTMGAIVGAIGCSILLIAWLGTQQTQRLLIALSSLAALILLAPRNGRREEEARGERGPILTLLAGALALAGLLAWSVPPVPWKMIAHGRYLPIKDEIGKLLYVGEGINASVAVTERSNGVRNFHVSGKVEASTEPQDMQLQRMLGHLPALLHPRPRAVLVVGCGAGITAGSFLTHPDLQQMVICEIEALIPRMITPFFARENYQVLQDPRVKVVYDDARHFILTTRDKFDIITSDPIHPWVKGAATLYTQEYFELCKQHLNPGGVVTQWVPLYESNREAVKSEIATFFNAFPNGTIWSNDQDGEGYDLVLLGEVDLLRIKVDDLQERLSREPAAAQSLKEVGFSSIVSLLATYAGQKADLGPWLKEAEINRDRNLRLQYLAGLGANRNQGAIIYDEMLAQRRFPENIFVASEPSERLLRRLIEKPNAGRQIPDK